MQYFKWNASLVLSVLLFCFSLSAQAANTDPNTIWPLCGRITESPPVGWVDTDGCPSVRAGDAAFSDAPFSATFGPRPLFSESNRYDFHRGVDIATPIGTPFYAITDGNVEVAGVNASFSDPLVKVRHFRPGETSCAPTGCYHSYYLHISSWVVAVDDQVVKGQLLGYTGASSSEFEHLHFEVRDAPAFDVFSGWSRDAIHPFSTVPYLAPNNTTIVFNNVDLSAPGAGVVNLTLTSNRYDLAKVSLAFFDSNHQPLVQSGNTPDANGYLLNPSSFDMEDWNFMYSHKDSTNFPWASFGAGGAEECPYHADHGGSYDANVHMDAQNPGNPLEGQFNGLRVITQKYWPSDEGDYQVSLEFQALEGPAACVEATAEFSSGDTSIVEWGDCSGTSSNSLLTRGPYLQMQTDDSMTIHWRTDIPTDSVVKYGTTDGNLTNTASVAGSRTEHKVVLNNLGADQHYWYSVEDSIGKIAGDSSFHFYTAPLQGDPADTRIWVLGDAGTANSNQRAVRDAYKTWSASNPANIVLMLGDNAYNDGTDAEYQAAVFDIYPEILRQLPLWSTLGNHDGHNADSASQTGPYYEIFNLPDAGQIGGLPSGTEAYYSFDYANIHFVCLDSYDTDRSVGGTMMTWLENDLALNTQPWVIAFWHHPPYTKGSHDSDTEGQLIDMRENALPILEDMGVDLVMSGHSHSYERSYLLDGHYGVSTTLDPDIMVLNPGDGKDTGDGAYAKPDVIAAPRAGAVYATAGSSGKISNAPLDHPAMYFAQAVLGSMLVDVSGNRMDVVFLNQAGSVLDEFTILKGPDLEPPLIAAASAEDATHVVVSFNESLDALEANIASNYQIGGIGIISAELLADARSVRLTTSAMTSETMYTLSVSNVQDLALNTILFSSQTSFEFVSTMSVSFQDGLLPSPSYDGTSDAYIREYNPDTNYGLNTTIQVDGSEPSGSETDMNTVLGWDISSIPDNATVVSADIQLEVTNVSSGPFECYSLLTAWDQTGVTWNSASNGVAWNSPGASSASDRGTQVACSIAAPSTGPLTVSLTAYGLSLVQSWIANPGSNHGLIIANPSTSNGADFHSSESSTSMARPRLNVTYSVPVVGNVDPVAGFTSSCTDLDCSFTDSSTDSDGAIGYWAWSFGDGSSSGDQNPSHSYAAAGNYTVTLTVMDNIGAFDSDSQSVTVSAANVAPTAGFGASCTDLDCSFTDSSSDSDGTISSWSWNFGDGNSSSAQNPSHSYASAGNYTVVLTVTDNDAATDSSSQGVTVSAANVPPTAGFGASCTNLDCSFTDSSSDSDGTISSWSWSFGDGNSSSAQNPSHSYASAGNYTVVLTVTDNDAATDFSSQGVNVTAANLPPTAGFGASCTDLDCSFTDSSSDSDGTISTWSWNFGDGNSSSAQNPSHSYASAGNYTVVLTVTDNDAATDSSSQGVTVSAANVPPTAGFGASCTNLDCSFSDSSSDSDGSISSWSWSFGDGNSSSAENPSHSYASAGNYTVVLTVTDNNGATDQFSDSVTASEPAGFTDYPADADLPSAGSISGSFANTFNDDSSIQRITERESGGKKNSRYSYLSHTWRFAAASGSMVTFITNAWSSGSNDGDEFEFAWSTDNNNFNYMFTVSSTATNNVQSAIIPSSGVLYIRVTDTNRSAGNRELNDISIDQMFIRGDNTVPTDPPSAPSNLSVGTVTSSSIALSWQHNGTGEQSFDIERSPAGSGAWASLDSIAGGSTSYVDSTVSPSTSYDYRISASNSSGVSAWSNTASGTTPAAPSITLNATGYKIKGKQNVDLDWTGTGNSVEIIRDNVTITTLNGQSSYTDNIGSKGGATYVYKVCTAGTSECSANVVVVF